MVSCTLQLPAHPDLARPFGALIARLARRSFSHAVSGRRRLGARRAGAGFLPGWGRPESVSHQLQHPHSETAPSATAISHRKWATLIDGGSADLERGSLAVCIPRNVFGSGRLAVTSLERWTECDVTGRRLTVGRVFVTRSRAVQCQLLSSIQGVIRPEETWPTSFSLSIRRRN